MHDGRYLASAVLTWDDDGHAKAEAIHFCKLFPTEKRAVHYALRQIYVRLNEGRL